MVFSTGFRRPTGPVSTAWATGSAPRRNDFALILDAVLEWIHAKATHPGADRRRLAPLLEVWEKIRRSARDAETFNLDKRTTILSIFADLAQASRLH